ncbi:MAG: amidohydrolase family protein [Proteobacteria bacterium]|jgi:predicted amidohydrolase YtcJ|nr:amidohydrolase family protein [Pseudomonadota bacterium]
MQTLMNHIKKLILPIAVLFTFTASSIAAQEAPDTILFNGKIVTVDDYFSIQQAVAISGEQIAAVGDNETIQVLANPDTRLIDLGGRTVIPGLIDNHNHIIRATEYWPNEARLDGISSRTEALQILEAKANSMPAGQWLMSLGGWTEAQFIGNRADFTLAELDELSPARPAFIQSTYDHVFVNTAWLEEMDIPMILSAADQEATTGLASYIVRDESGTATGRLNGGISMVALAIERFPKLSEEEQVSAISSAFSYLNGLGLTAVYDPAGVGISEEIYERLASVADTTGLTLRVFHTLGGGAPSTPEEARAIVEQIETSRPFQGNTTLDLIAVGEIYYAPFHWDSLFTARSPNSDDIAAARSILTAAAKGGWSVQTHATQPATIDILLDVMTEINAEYPLRQLRWSVTHADRITITQIERMRHLGMTLQMRSISVTKQPRRYQLIEELGEAAYQVPPLRLVQNSGIPFGLGTDGTKAAQINPFVSLWWAVTGLSLNGDVVLKDTLSRENALIAHTRANAYLMFQENNTGSIRPGLLADLLVLDRDYLTVPDAEIKDIKLIATLVGGKIVSGEL